MAIKSELELGRKACHAIALDAIQAEQRHEYLRVIDLSLQSLPLIDSAIQFERKFLKIEQPPTPTIRLIFEYAPLFFWYEAIDRVEELVTQNKRIERLTGQDFRGAVMRSRELLEESARLWDALESQGSNNEAPIEREGRWSSILEIWQRAGLIVPPKNAKPLKWVFRTRFDSNVRAKCSRCGQITESRKMLFLSDINCIGCKTNTNHVILDFGH